MTLLDTLRKPPESLAPWQRGSLIVASAIAAVSRLPARNHSMWDWDEALFCLGVRSYNVVLHRPHPPGYPLFIAAAKLVRLLVHSDLLALQVVVLLAGAAILPLLFFFAREARFPFATALGGSLLFVFLPNVWIYSGSAMSDIPALAVTVLACALLLRGCRSRFAYFGGAIALGIAAGIRPQALLVGMACGAIATIVRWRDDRRGVVIAALVGGVVIAASYGGAALASDPPNEYLSAVRLQSQWVHNVDSYHNPHRTPLGVLAPIFFFKPIASNAVEIVSALAALGTVFAIVRVRAPALVTAVTFVPIAIFAWLMLDAMAVSRYAIGYMPLHALLAADAVAAVTPRRVQNVQMIVMMILAASLAWWTWPAVRSIRANDAPPIAATRWVLHNAYPGAGTLFIHNAFGPFAEYFFAGYDKHFFETAREVPSGGYLEPAYVLVPEVSKASDAHVFVRRRDRLWHIVRQRYFEASVIPAWDLIRFGQGWHDEEDDGTNHWRWMKQRSETLLPPIGPKGRLTLHFYVPVDTLRVPPTIELTFNGVVVDRFVATTDVNRSWILPSRAGKANDLRLSTSKAVIPAQIHSGGDPRELGLKLLAITWQPATR